MKHWKSILFFVLLAVLLLGTMTEGFIVTTWDVSYNFKFNGGLSSHYTIPLPNTCASTPQGETQSFSGQNVIIGDAQTRSYKVRGHYRVELSDKRWWNQRTDTPSFRIGGVVSPVYKLWPGSNPFGTYHAEGNFEILPGQTATVTYNSGHYLSRFLGFLTVTNRWGIPGSCTIQLDLDSENPDPPQNIKLNGAAVTRIISGSTVGLSWEAAVDNPPIPGEASGIKGYKIFDGETDITPNGGYITGLSQTVTLVGEREHTIQIQAYDNENNPSDPALVYVQVDQTPPTGKLSIESNSGFTNLRDVTLAVTELSDSSLGSPGSGLSQVGFSNIKNTDNYTWFDFTPGDPAYGWQLSEVDGVKTVYMKLKDRAGNITPHENAISATIILDTNPPTGSFTINNGAAIATSQQVSLALEAADSLSGLAGMMFSNDGATYSITEDYTAIKSWTLSRNGGTSKTVYIMLTDKAGNTSSPIYAEITYDPDPVYTDSTPETTLAENETWTENRAINGRIIVPSGVTLTIGPNVTVTAGSLVNNDPYQNGFIIEAGGTLRVETGVTFQVHSSKPGWMGIIISGTGVITGANISLAQRGIAVLSGTDVTITGCSFSQNFTGIHVYASHPAITNCTFQGNTYGIKEDAIVEGQHPLVNGCTFTSNWVAYYHDPWTRIAPDRLNSIPGNAENH
jgi:parallel beta-helix repeat protein